MPLLLSKPSNITSKRDESAEATLQAMREVTGPVIGVALVLAAVFIPTAFLPGHYRAVVSTICPDDCHLRDLVGIQRAYT